MRSLGWRVFSTGFEFQHFLFRREAAGGAEAGELAGGTEDAVAGDEDGPGIVGDGGADGAGGAGLADAVGDLAVGHVGAGGDEGDSLKDAALEGRELVPVEAGLPEVPVVDELGVGPGAEGGGVVILEIGDEAGEPVGDGIGVEMRAASRCAAACAEDFVAVGEGGEDVAA